MTDTITTLPHRKEPKDWAPSRTDFAVIIDGLTGKQVADFASPHLSEDECLENIRLALAAPKLLEALNALLKHSEKVNYAFYVEGKAKAMQAAMQGQKELLQAARAAIGEATDDSVGRVA